MKLEEAKVGMDVYDTAYPHMIGNVTNIGPAEEYFGKFEGDSVFVEFPDHCYEYNEHNIHYLQKAAK